MDRRFGVIWLTIFTMIVLPTSILGQVEPYNGGIQTRSLVTQPVDDSRSVVLSANTRSEASQAHDRGPVPDRFPMDHLLLQLQRPPELEQELVNLIDEMHRPGSPEFHHWLTPRELGRRFGPSRQDMRRITDWLTSHGFQINSVYPTGMVIDFSGNAAQVREAFHTEIHNLDVNGEAHISNMRDPQIPAALAGAVTGVVSLHNFMPHPNYRRRPEFDVTISGTEYYAVAPADLATIYNLNPLFAAGLTGVGQIIAVIENTNIENASDVGTFRSAFGLSTYPGTFTQVNPSGPTTCTNPGVNSDEDEAALDAEWAGAAAPGAAIELASCADTATVFGGLIALENLVNAGAPPAIMSISYGECESENGAAANAAYVNAYQAAVAQGVSVFVAAGDEGAASCDANATAATHGIAVSGFASTPYNVAVGGTDFSDTDSGTLNTYWNPTNAPTLESAISYIPEIPWNDSCASQLIFTTLFGFAIPYGATGACNNATVKSDGFVNTVAGSGGPSRYSAKPSWQSVLGNPADTWRDIPDVSLFAANGVWRHFYVYCMSDTAEGGATCDYSNSTDVLALAAGGTSFSSPIMAGIMALVNQHSGSAQGNPNPRLYALAGAEYGASGSTTCNSSLGNTVGGSCVFYDVTLGDIDVPCKGTTNCYKPSSTYGVLSTSNTAYDPAYPASTGWDFATGIGTVNAYNLVYGWLPASTPTPTTTPTPATAPTSTPRNTPTGTPTSSPTQTPTRTPSSTATSTPTNTPTPSPTATSTPTNTPTSTSSSPTPTLKPTNTQTPTATPTATNTATQTPTAVSTATVTPANTQTPTLTPTAANTATQTPTATSTGTVTPPNTQTPTLTLTPTATNTATQTLTATSTGTVTPPNTQTPTAANTATQTLTATSTGTVTPPNTQTPTLTPSAANTATQTLTATSTGTVTPPNTQTPTLTPSAANTATQTPTAVSTGTVTPTNTQTPPPTVTRTATLTPVATRTVTGTATATAVPALAAAFIGQSVPAAMTAGQQTSVSVTMQNTGTATWTAAGAYRLGAINPYDNATWGTNRVGLASGESIAPGQQKTFTWTVTAPATAGPYNFQWRMVQDGVAWFGNTSTNAVVTVAAATGPNATFVSQSVPSSMTAGRQTSVSLTMQNTGGTTWTAASLYRLGAINPYDNATWGTNRVGLASGESIAPGQQKTFTWTVTAPATPGPYNFQWRMVQDGVAWFGNTSTNVVVTVAAATGPNAAFVSQSVPSSMTAGQQTSVSVTMQNTGGTTWTAAGAYRLGAVNPYDNATWGTNRVGLASGESIAPGQQKTFTWTATAPATPGPYNFQWRMVQDGVTWFGDLSTNAAVTVGP